ncbi:MAG: exo-alpha-sialidase [Ignavibacteria bacterium]|nr:exo-alpha-sialidase [Ignavibacteria bacterium]
MSIAVSPKDSTELVVGDNTIPRFLSSIWPQGYYLSLDQGISWSGHDTVLYENATDPTVSFDLDGFQYMCFISGNNIYVAEYEKTRKNWRIPGQPIPNTSNPNKTHMAIDVNATSPFKNNIYVAWLALSDSPKAIMFSRSTDRGVSFSYPKRISGASGYAAGHGVNLAIGPNGEIYATWVYFDVIPGYESALGFTRSLDSGRTWNAPIRLNVSGFSGIWARVSKSEDPREKIRVSSFPSMDVDRTQGPRRGTIYLVWANGSSATDHTKPNVMMIKSTDGGDTWSNTKTVNDDATYTDQWSPWINVDFYGGVNIVFYDGRIDPTNNFLTQVYLARSTDGGNFFSNYQISDYAFVPTAITSEGYYGDYIGITSTKNYVVATWHDNHTGIYQAYAARMGGIPLPLQFRRTGTCFPFRTWLSILLQLRSGQVPFLQPTITTVRTVIFPQIRS